MAIKDRIDNMTTMKFTDARAHLSEVFNTVARQETRVLVEKNGVPVGVIVSPKDYERFQWLEREAHEKAIAALNAFSDAFKDVPEDDLEREIANAIEESRIELRAEAAVAALGDVFKSDEDHNRAYAKALAEAREAYRAETERANQRMSE